MKSAEQPADFVHCPVLEAISDRIRCGEPVGLFEAIAAIDYQERRQAHERNNVWWRRVVRWIRRNFDTLEPRP